MPLIIKANGPINGTIAMPPTWERLFSSVPNFLGAWKSSNLTVGALSTWNASYGSAVLRQTTSSAQPTVVSTSGGNVVQGDLGKRLDLSTALTSGAQLTIAMRVNLLDNTIDGQALFGGNSTWRARFRNNAGGAVNLEAGGGTISRPMVANGWRDVVVVQDAASVSLTVDGGAPVSRASAGATITSLAIGALAANDTTTNWRGYISHVAISSSGLTGENLDTFSSWLSS